MQINVFNKDRTQLSSPFFITLAVMSLLVIFYGSFFTHPITLVTSDLGRHVQNGRLFFEDWRVITTNFYSYTEPEFPVVNHHWGSGALFYGIWKFFGFLGVQLFVIALNITAFLISFFLSRKHAGAGLAAFVAILIIPILGTRTELRPESFSYLFAMLFFLTLVRIRDNPMFTYHETITEPCHSRESGNPGLSIRKQGFIQKRVWIPAFAGMTSEGRIGWCNIYRNLFLLIFLELCWVNSHIYFFLGPLFVLAFLLETIIVKRLRGNIKQLTLIFFYVSAITLVNPFGIRGAIAPFTILQQYGYRLVENQSVWFLEKLMANPSFFIYKLVFTLLCISFITLILWRLRGKTSGTQDPAIAFLCLAVGVSAMAWLQIRNFALFSFVALPIIAQNIGVVFHASLEKYKQHIAAAAFLVLFFIFLITISGGLSSLFPYWQSFGLGLEPKDQAAAEFFQAQHLHGPIFNNYDIGGYLIFHLFPGERVFVDNRPEAYSVNFFEKTYIPMQETSEKWQETFDRFGFNAIFFSYRDMTPWAQKFLADRIQDSEWAAVFADRRVIIFLRNTMENKSVIERFAIPKERFITR